MTFCLAFTLFESPNNIDIPNEHIETLVEKGGHPNAFTDTDTKVSSFAVTCPPNQSFSVSSTLCEATITITGPSSNCAITSLSYTISGPSTPTGTTPTDPSGTYQVGSYTITWLVTDCDGTSLCIQNILVEDLTTPTMMCPGTTFQCPGSTIPPIFTDLASFIAGGGSVADNCMIDASTFSATETTTGSGCDVTITRNYQISDVNGNFSNCNQMFILRDNMPPTVICPSDVNTLVCGDTPPAPATTLAEFMALGGLVADGCDLMSISSTDVSNGGMAGCSGSNLIITRTYTVTDACGNMGTCDQLFSYANDVTPPTASNPVGITAQCVAPAPDPTVVTDEMDACGTPVVAFVSDVSDGMTCPETITRTYSVTDPCGNSINVTQTITLNDTTLPTASNPVGITAQCVAPTPDPTVVIDETDNCGAAPTVAFVGDVSNGMTCPETITRTYSVTDPCGNSINVTQTITLNDTTLPTASNPGPINVECAAAPMPDPTVVTDEADNCGTAPTVAFVSDVSDGMSCPETITRTYSVTDLCGNAINVTQDILINDTTDPTAICPPILVLECDGDYAAEIATWLATASGTDGCSATLTITNDYVTGTLPALSCDATTGLTVLFTVTDDCGNSDTCTSTIVITDTEDPMVNCPSDLVLECDGDYASEIATWLTTVSASDDCDMSLDITNDYVIGTLPALSCDLSMGLTVTFTAEDDCGNTNTCTAEIFIDDTQNPTASNLAPMTVACNAPLPDINLVLDEMDACGTPLVTFVSDVSDGMSCPETITRTYSVTDACANSINVTQMITVNDLIAPTLTCPPNQTGLNCNSSLPIAATDEASFIAAGGMITENCGVVSVTSVDDVDPSSFSFCAADGPFVVTRTYTVSDACGSANCIQTFTFDPDTTPPSFTCGADLTINATGSDCFAMVTISVPSPTDNCTATGDITLVNDMNGMADASGNYPVGTTTITWTATDDCGNFSTCQINVTVVDAEAPSITCPADVSVECSAPTAATTVAEFTALGGTVSDNCGTAMLTISHVDVSDGNTCPEVITRTYTVSDGTNSVSCSQMITIDDDEAPVLTCGADFTINTDAGQCSAMATIAIPGSSDNCGITTFVNDFNGMMDASGVYPVGTTTIIWTATDACGNSTTCSVSLTVQDNQSPVITCPTSVSVACDISQAPAATTITEFINQGGTVSDNCGTAMLTISHVDVSDGNTCPELITRTYTISDGTNSVNCNQTITIDDETAPVISCPANTTVECGGDISASANGTASATDNCTAVNDIIISSSDVSAPGCGNTEIITRTWTATDACGNQDQCVQTITVNDTTDPVISCPMDLVLECDNDYTAEINAWIVSTTATDGCGTVTITNDYVPGTLPMISCSATTGLTVMFTATDACGNTDVCTATIIIDDTLDPVITCPLDLVLECDNDYTAEINAWIASASATDGCDGMPTITTNYVAGTLPALSCDQSSGLDVSFTATDDCGNTDVCVATIIIDDNVDPVITCPMDLVLECDGDYTAEINTWLASVSATDGCDLSLTITNNYVAGTIPALSCDQTGNIMVTFTVTDDCGNTDECMAAIILDDNVDPVITCPMDLILECDGDYTAEINTWLASVSATDGCDGMPTITTNYVAGTLPALSCDQSSGLDVSFTATDDCGNTDVCVATIIIDDNVDPVITCPMDLVLECDGDYTAEINTWLASVSATDGCDAMPTITNDYVMGTLPQLACISSPGLVNPIIVEFIATDDCGNTDVCTATIQIIDTVDPVITCPGDVTGLDCNSTLPVGATDETSFVAAGGTIMEDCGVTSVTFVDDLDPANFSFCTADGPFVVTRTYTVTDGCGNTDTCVQTFTFDADTTPPVITCPDNVSGLTCGTALPAGATNEASFMAAGGTISENCAGIVSVSFVDDGTPASIDNCMMGVSVITRTYTVTDACGNASTCDQTFTYVEDTEAPMVDCSVVSDMTFECGTADLDAMIAFWIAAQETALLATATDNCDATPTIRNNYITGTLPDEKSCGDPNMGLLITLIVEDDCGNQNTDCFIRLILDDTTPPLIDCSTIDMNLVLECGTGDFTTTINDWLDQIETDILNAPGTIDNCTGALTASNNYMGGLPTFNCTEDPSNGIQVEFVVEDCCGNVSPACIGTIFLNDTTDPIITCPPSVTGLDCNSILAAPATDEASFIALGGTIDEDCGIVSVSASDDSDPSTFSFCAVDGPFQVVRTYTITDACGNSDTCVQTFDFVADTTPPVIACPAEVTVECDESTAPGNTGVATAIDNCTTNVLINFVDVSTQTSDGSCTDYQYTITRTWRATDACGNFSECDQIINVQDMTAPSIICPDDITVSCESDFENCPVLDYIDITCMNMPGGIKTYCLVYATVAEAMASLPKLPLVITVGMDDANQQPYGGGTEICYQTAMMAACNVGSFELGIGSVMATDNCTPEDDIVITYTDVSTQTMDGSCSDNSYLITRTWRATDACGNFSECEQMITVTDEVAPVVDCTAATNLLTLECSDDPMDYDAIIQAWITAFEDDILNAPGTMDNCSTNLSVSNDYTVGTYPMLDCTANPNNGLTVEFIVEDACGNEAPPCIGTIVLDDTMDPVLDCPMDLVLECDGNYAAEIDAWLASVAASDGCDATPTVTNNYVMGSLPVLSCDLSVGLEVTFTATDDCGNTDVCMATIFIDDTVPPVLTCPMDLVLECDGDYAAEIGSWLEMVSATDDCDALVSITNDYATGSLPVLSCDLSVGLDVTFTATDDCGNASTCIRTIFIDDTMNPTITCPDPLKLECDGDYQSEIDAWVASIVATDACDQDITITNNYAPGTFPPLSCDASDFIDVTFIATDDCGNTATCVAMILLGDNIAPVITCPNDVTGLTCNSTLPVPATDEAGFIALGGTIDEDCGLMSITSMDSDDPANFSFCSADGPFVITRTYTATDNCGNTGTCIQTFTFDPDTTPPVINPVAIDGSVECDGTADPMGAFANWLANNGGAMATDNCDNSVSWSNNSTGLSDLCGFTGSETVTFTATDNCGNTSTTSATFTIVDTTDPTFTVPGPVTVECDEDVDDLTITGDVTDEADDCSGTIEATYSDDTSGLTGCNNTGVLVRTWTLEDDCGNSTSQVQNITIIDTTNPTITCPMLSPVGTNSTTCDADVTIPLPVSNDCGIVDLTWVATNGTSGMGDASGTYPLGTTTITFTATDECGNTAMCDVVVEVIDDVGPALTCDDDVCIVLDDDGEVTVPASTFVISAVDNCGTVVSTQAMIVGAGLPFADDITVDCNTKGIIMVMVEVTDDAGNTSQCTVDVTVKDNTNPGQEAGGSSTCPTDLTINCEFIYDPNNPSLTFGTVVFDLADQNDIVIDGTVVGQDGFFTDNCGDGLSILSDNIDDSGVDAQCGEGIMIRTIVVTDASGNTTSCQQMITIEDEDPFTCDEVTWPPDFVETDCTMVDFDPMNTGAPTWMLDNCSLVGTNFTDVTISDPNSGCVFIERTWTLIDWCQYDANNPVDIDPADGEIDGLCTYVQNISVVNSIAPVISGCVDTLICANPNTCLGDMDFSISATDDCTDDEDLIFIWSLDIDGAGTTIINGIGNTVSGVFPQGNHILSWTVDDRCGNEAMCSMVLSIQDCKAPNLACKYGLSTSLHPKNGEGCVLIWANDFVQSLEDNCTATGDIQISFSSDVNDTSKKFTCDDLGNQSVEIWATDEDGNQTHCVTFIDIQDNLNICTNNGPLMLAGEVATALGIPVLSAQVRIESDQMSDDEMTDDLGVYAFSDLTNNDDYMVTPEKLDEVTNGVSTIDLVIIQKHLLEIAPLDSPYKLIAADANSNEEVSAIDLIEIRKLILGITDEFPNNDSWRFVDKKFVFPDPNNPWPFKEQIMNQDMTYDNMDVDFVGVKIGDVNDSVESNLSEETSNRTNNSLILEVENQEFLAGEIVKVNVLAKEFVDIIGLQYTLDFDENSLEYIAIEGANIMLTEANIGLHTKEDHKLSFSWNDVYEKSFEDNAELYRISFMAKKAGNLKDLISVDNSITKALAYDKKYQEINVELRVIEKVQNFKLYQNSPNPFISTTEISFDLDKENQVNISVYTEDGKLLWNKEGVYSQGRNTLTLQKSDIGDVAGILYLEVTTDRFVDTKKMISLK